jgi:hypothetical protein
MEIKMYQSFESQERRKLLEENCDGIELIDYTKKLSREELIERKDRLAKISIDEKEILEEKRQVMQEFKDRLESITDEKSVLLKEIKQEEVQVTQDCYKFVADIFNVPEKGRVGYYNTQGILVKSRKANPEDLKHR